MTLLRFDAAAQVAEAVFAEQFRQTAFHGRDAGRRMIRDPVPLCATIGQQFWLPS